MKKINRIWHYSLMAVVAMLLTSCNLFIEDDEAEGLLPEYNGNGYDEVAHETTDTYDVSYQYKPSTMELNADNDLTPHIVSVESDEETGVHTLHFDASTPKELLPQPMQGVISSNLDLFEYGLCDIVYLVDEEAGGGYVVTSKHTELQNLFNELNFSADIPFDDYVDEYDLYDDEGNFVAHVDNRVANARTRAEEADDDYIPVNVPIEFDGLSKGPLSLTIKAGVQFKLYCSVDFSLDKGLTFEFKAKDGEFSVGYEVKVSEQFEKELLKGTFYKGVVPIGPVPVAVSMGASVGFSCEASISTSLTYKKPFEFTVGFDGEDFYNNSTDKDGKLEITFNASGSMSFPVIKLWAGFGLGTSAITVRAEIFIQLDHTLTLADGGTANGVADIRSNPRLESEVKVGVALALVAEGKLINKILGKIKSFIKEKMAKLKPLGKTIGSVAASMTSSTLGKVLNGEAMNSEELDLYNSILEQWKKDNNTQNNPTVDDLRKMYHNSIDEDLKKKQPKVPNSSEINGSTNNSFKDDDELALRLGPFYPIKFKLLEKYLYPKINDKSFRIGRKWNKDKTKLIFTAEYKLDDPGLSSLWQKFYPGFIIKRHDTEILQVMCAQGPIDSDTPSGRMFTAEINGLEEGLSYTCIPCYSEESDGTPTIVNKGLQFTSVTPSMFIQDLRITEAQEIVKANMESGSYSYSYTCHFDTYSHVDGLRNISHWGIIDENDKNESTRYHTEQSVAGKNAAEGSFIHHWVCKSKNRTVKLKLTPYILAKDDHTSSDMKNAKKFETWSGNYDLAKYGMTTTEVAGSRTRMAESAYTSPWQEDYYELELLSVDFLPE